MEGFASNAKVDLYGSLGVLASASPAAEALALVGLQHKDGELQKCFKVLLREEMRWQVHPKSWRNIS